MQTSPHPQNGKTLVYILVGLTALALGLTLALLWRQPPPPPVLSHNVTRLDHPRPLQSFDLIDHNGQRFDLQRLQGRWTLLFFGYTNCPDVCPTTMATLNAAQRHIDSLPSPPPDPQILFVTVDPERDDVAQLAKFVPYFNPDFLGVTGPLPAVDAFTKQLSIMYMKVEPDRPGGYLMDHSAAVLLIDPQARFHALFSAPFDAAAMARDYQQLAKYYEATS